MSIQGVTERIINDNQYAVSLECVHFSRERSETTPYTTLNKRIFAQHTNQQTPLVNILHTYHKDKYIRSI